MGDAVTAVDMYGDGRSQLVVLNGADSAAGPVQLIAAESSGVPGLVAGWSCDEGSGTVARDCSPHGNDGNAPGAQEENVSVAARFPLRR